MSRKSFDFGEQTGRHHRVDSNFDPSRLNRAIPAQTDLGNRGIWVAVDARPERAKRSPAAFAHLKGAHDTPGVRGFHLAGGGRIDCSQPSVEMLRTACCDFRFETLSHYGPFAWHREVIDHCAVIQTRAANQQGPTVSIGEIGQHSLIRGLELGNREFVSRFDEIDQVVTNLLLFVRCRLRGPDAHSSVHLHRIDRNHFNANEF